MACLSNTDSKQDKFISKVEDLGDVSEQLIDIIKDLDERVNKVVAALEIANMRLALNDLEMVEI